MILKTFLQHQPTILKSNSGPPICSSSPMHDSISLSDSSGSSKSEKKLANLYDLDIERTRPRLKSVNPTDITKVLRTFRSYKDDDGQRPMVKLINSDVRMQIFYNEPPELELLSDDIMENQL
jgi:hypothetical protein